MHSFVVYFLTFMFLSFLLQIIRDLNTERKLAFRGMLLSAVASVGILPMKMRDSFLANYKICPPPLFIPVITLLQVLVYVFGDVLILTLWIFVWQNGSHSICVYFVMA